MNMIVTELHIFNKYKLQAVCSLGEDKLIQIKCSLLLKWVGKVGGSYLCGSLDLGISVIHPRLVQHLVHRLLQLHHLISTRWFPKTYQASKMSITATQEVINPVSEIFGQKIFYFIMVKLGLKNVSVLSCPCMILNKKSKAVN